MTYRHPDRISFYHPYNFLVSPGHAEKLFIEDISRGLVSKKVSSITDDQGNSLIYELLTWDSEFFGRPIYKVHFFDLAPHSSVAQIDELLRTLISSLKSPNVKPYLFIEIPSEDLEVLESVSQDGWKLIETRITYYHPNISVFDTEIMNQTRLANHEDVIELRRTAAGTKNYFDRFHSDSYFSEEEVDRFMGVFIENSVGGREDYVVVPKDGPANAFFAGSKVEVDSSLSIGRMTLSAVSTERKGWHIDVTRALCCYFQQDHIQTAVMTTQSTNRAVLANLAKLNFRFGRASHIFSRVII
jgi:dTDP-4-amino-4,6-dideoxy-D-galactose acyltransferase